MVRDAIAERLDGRAAVHAAALVWPLGIVANQVGIEHGLHLLDRLEPGLAPLHAEVLVQQCAVQPLDDAVGLWPANPGPLMFDARKLEEQLYGGTRMPVRSSAT